jgi:hypothetical protein
MFKLEQFTNVTVRYPWDDIRSLSRSLLAVIPSADDYSIGIAWEVCLFIVVDVILGAFWVVRFIVIFVHWVVLLRHVFLHGLNTRSQLLVSTLLRHCCTLKYQISLFLMSSHLLRCWFLSKEPAQHFDTRFRTSVDYDRRNGAIIGRVRNIGDYNRPI